LLDRIRDDHSYLQTQPIVTLARRGFQLIKDKLTQLVLFPFADAKKIDPAVLLSWRLAPDMYPLVRQVQIVADQAKTGASRLAGIEPPRYEDNETTIDQLKQRITKTIEHLKSIDGKHIDASADKDLTFPLGPNNKGHMKGRDYLNHFVMPNFYFHLTAAYAILRNCGVELGKRDFMGSIPMTMT
jgi:uncharacterized protein